MMREEFEKLTGLKVSYNYYTKKIEPEYAEVETDKESFCMNWLKTHKADICKTIESDIEHMSITESTQAAKIEQLERVRQAEFDKRSEAEEKVKKLERSIQSLNADVARLTEHIKKLESESSDKNEKLIASKDMEIIKLKAMLFDALYKTA